MHEAYEPLNNMAFCLYELGHKDEAIARWQQALSIEPNSPDANAGLGMALYMTRRQDDGITFYRNALRIKAEYADEQWLRAVALWSERAIADSQALRAASIQ
jgi:tetratricopeptide (TPR) repeat protein